MSSKDKIEIDEEIFALIDSGEYDDFKKQYRPSIDDGDIYLFMACTCSQPKIFRHILKVHPKYQTLELALATDTLKEMIRDNSIECLKVFLEKQPDKEIVSEVLSTYGNKPRYANNKACNLLQDYIQQ